MKITYRDLLNARNALQTLLQVSPAPTARIGAQIARNVRVVNNTLQDFDTAHKLMVKPYLDDSGQLRALDPATEAALNAEYQELLDTAVDIDVHPLRMADLEQIEQVRPGFEIPIAVFFDALFMFETQD